MNILFTKSRPHYSQQGIVLVTALIMLLVLTILGVTAMNNSTMQTLMAGNSQYQTVALNRAELTIRAGETLVDNIIGGAPLPPGGYYDITPGNDPEIDPFNAAFNWYDPNSTVGPTPDGSYYYVEYAGEKDLPPESLAWRQSQGIPGSTIYLFRITARSPAARGAIRFVQSIYVTEQAPF